MAASLYVYVVDRDLGFAPNPFHGYCTLATCKPKIREHAQIEDWVMGVGGSRLKATGKCICLFKVSEKLTFSEYWSDVRFQKKKPLRNGSMVMMVGDNIYHKTAGGNEWIQEDSHHSKEDGSCNMDNLRRDTLSTNVLVSDHFYYFGMSAPEIDLASIGYKNHIGCSKKALDDEAVTVLITTIEEKYKNSINMVIDDPFNFDLAVKRVDQKTGKIS